MEEIIKCIAIIRQNNSMFVERNNDMFSFLSFVLDDGIDIDKTIKKKLGISNDIPNVGFSVELWKTEEHIDKERNKKEIVRFYIIEVSEAIRLSSNYHKININNIEPNTFCDGHRKTYEFLRAIPDRKTLNCDDLYGQVYFENGQMNITLINPRLLRMELDSMEKEETFPLFFYEYISNEITFVNKELENKSEWDGRLFSIKITDNNEKDYLSLDYPNNEGVIITALGNILFSASPISYKKRTRILIKDLDGSADAEMINLYESYKNEWMIKIYPHTIRDRKNIYDWLDKNYSKINSNTLDVKLFNVGQANCCLCDLQTRKFFFDIGVTYVEAISNNKYIKSAINAFASEKDIDDVFVSHWDLDHILGVVYKHDTLLGKTWLGPDFRILYKIQKKDVSISILTLVFYLIFVGKSTVMLVDTSSTDKKLFESDQVSVYLGTPKTTRINVLNNGGIILKLQNNNNILCPGDCDNAVIPLCALTGSFDNVLVPHHGSVMEPPVVLGRKSNGNNNAYISIGKKTGNFREDKKIRKAYKTQGFSHIRRTRRLTKSDYFKIVL